MNASSSATATLFTDTVNAYATAGRLIGKACRWFAPRAARAAIAATMAVATFIVDPVPYTPAPVAAIVSPASYPVALPVVVNGVRIVSSSLAPVATRVS